MASQNSLVVIGRASYLNIWEKRAFDRGEPMYSMALLVSKRDKKTLAAIDKAVNAAIEMGKDKYWKGRVPQKFTYPMHDGDIEKPDQKRFEKCRCNGAVYTGVDCDDYPVPRLLQRRYLRKEASIWQPKQTATAIRWRSTANLPIPAGSGSASPGRR